MSRPNKTHFLCRVLLIVCGIMMTIPAASQQTAEHQVIARRIQNLLTDSLTDFSNVGLCVYDLSANCEVFAYRDRQYMRPASNQKVITSISALDILGNKYNYDTTLRCDTFAKGSRTLRGNLYVQGGFDPLFDNSDLRLFTDALVALGIDTVRGKIILDLSMKDTVSRGWGWCWDDKDKELTPLQLDGKNHRYFAQQFQKALRQAGIVLTNSSTGRGKAPDNAVWVATVTRTIDQILQPMMKQSDNNVAESLFYQIAARERSKNATRKDGAAAIKRLFSRLGIEERDYNIADGSGLSLYNYCTPRVLLTLLKHAYANKKIYDSLYPSLPIAGNDGTLQKRMTGTSAEGNVHAKTGTVTGVSSLSGFCTTAQGHLLCFSIMNNGITKAAVGRDFQDRVCVAMTSPIEPSEMTDEQ